MGFYSHRRNLLNLYFSRKIKYFDIAKPIAKWHRTYDPTLGRYLQSDPIGLVGGLNRYAYAGGSPMNFVNPTWEIVPLAVIAGGALFGAGNLSAQNLWPPVWSRLGEI